MLPTACDPGSCDSLQSKWVSNVYSIHINKCTYIRIYKVYRRAYYCKSEDHAIVTAAKSLNFLILTGSPGMGCGCHFESFTSWVNLGESLYSSGEKHNIVDAKSLKGSKGLTRPAGRGIEGLKKRPGQTYRGAGAG